jgi:hypothetical protein
VRPYFEKDCKQAESDIERVKSMVKPVKVLVKSIKWQRCNIWEEGTSLFTLDGRLILGE